MTKQVKKTTRALSVGGAVKAELIAEVKLGLVAVDFESAVEIENEPVVAFVLQLVQFAKVVEEFEELHSPELVEGEKEEDEKT